jgi:hypothetical protein
VGTMGEDLQQAFKLIQRFTTRPTPSVGRYWHDGTPPERGPALVVGDGLASRSAVAWGNLPWVDVLRPYLHQAVPPAIVRQFSYLGPGYHYDGRQTTIPFEQAGKRMDAYLPPPGVETSFIGFSLACPIFTLRLAQSALREGGAIPGLILFQPAIALQASVLHAWNRSAYRIPGNILRTLTPTKVDAFHTELVHAIRVLTETTTVHLLYWEGDKFIAYPSGFMERIATAGAIVDSVPNLQFPESTDNAFQQHCAIARHDDMLVRLTGLAQRLAR